LKFDELEAGGQYVAVTHGPFIQLNYGAKNGDDKEKVKRWNYDPKVEKKECSSLDSAESVEMYLKRCGYETVTGLPFPFDAPRPGSSHADHKKATKFRSPEPRTCQETTPLQNSLKKDKDSEQLPSLQKLEHSVKKDNEVAKATDTKGCRRVSIKDDHEPIPPISKSNSAFPPQIRKNLNEKDPELRGENSNNLTLPKLDNEISDRELEVKARIPESMRLAKNDAVTASNGRIDNGIVAVSKLSNTTNNRTENIGHDEEKPLNPCEELNNGVKCSNIPSSVDNGDTAAARIPPSEETKTNNKAASSGSANAKAFDNNAEAVNISGNNFDSKGIKEIVPSKSVPSIKTDVVGCPKASTVYLNVSDTSNLNVSSSLTTKKATSFVISNRSDYASTDTASEKNSSATFATETCNKRQLERKENNHFDTGNRSASASVSEVLEFSKKPENFTRGISRNWPIALMTQSTNTDKLQEPEFIRKPENFAKNTLRNRSTVAVSQSANANKLQESEFIKRPENLPRNTLCDRPTAIMNHSTNTDKLQESVFIRRPENLPRNTLCDRPTAIMNHSTNTDKLQESSNKQPKSILLNGKRIRCANSSNMPVEKLKYKADQVYIPLLIKSMKISPRPKAKDVSKTQQYNVTQDSSSSENVNTRFSQRLRVNRQFCETNDLRLKSVKKMATISADTVKSLSKEAIADGLYDNNCLENRRPMPMFYDPDFRDFDFL
uniref:MBD domain-containing protein n=1 Tax=Syphacia muris TaxID=451379 RepID=A0A0N5AAA4_9BILA